MTETAESDADLFLEAVRRRGALEALSSEPITKRHLAVEIDVSEATAHRILTSFRETGVVELTDDGYVVTMFGREVARAVDRYRSTVRAAQRLEPLLSAVGSDVAGLDVAAFADATVTQAGPGDPYAPVTRFMDLLSESDTLRGFDTTTIAPVYVDDVRREIMGGMAVSVVYLPPAVDQIADSYPEELADATESGHLELYTHDSLPFGLALFDDRIGLGAYDDETGMLTLFVDTDDPDAIEWGERLYEFYREKASPFDASALRAE